MLFYYYLLITNALSKKNSMICFAVDAVDKP